MSYETKVTNKPLLLLTRTYKNPAIEINSTSTKVYKYNSSILKIEMNKWNEKSES